MHNAELISHWCEEYYTVKIRLPLLHRKGEQVPEFLIKRCGFCAVAGMLVKKLSQFLCDSPMLFLEVQNDEQTFQGNLKIALSKKSTINSVLFSLSHYEWTNCSRKSVKMLLTLEGCREQPYFPHATEDIQVQVYFTMEFQFYQ